MSHRRRGSKRAGSFRREPDLARAADWTLQLRGGRGSEAAGTPLQGGVPIVLEGKVIGTIGVSGDTPQVDEAIAIAGASAFK